MVHPKDVPVSKTFTLKDVTDANEAVEDMVSVGFAGRKEGFKVLMPREKRIAKRIGYTVTTGVSYGLRKRGHPRDVKYWTYIPLCHSTGGLGRSRQARSLSICGVVLFDGPVFPSKGLPRLYRL